jgi:hypothetical protein
MPEAVVLVARTLPFHYRLRFLSLAASECESSE